MSVPGNITVPEFLLYPNGDVNHPYPVKVKVEYVEEDPFDPGPKVIIDGASIGSLGGGTSIEEYNSPVNGQSFEGYKLVGSVYNSKGSEKTVTIFIDKFGNVVSASGENIYWTGTQLETVPLTTDAPLPKATFGDAPCFVAGTMIHTTRGNIAVEHLRIGDVVITANSSRRKIVWLGCNEVEPIRHSQPEETYPFRIRAHAFGDHRPSRDLWLSPDHAVAVPCLSDVLIPIKHLDNGATISQVPLDRVVYWHVELEQHDVLLAENLPTESFLDTRGKSFFRVVELGEGQVSFPTRSGQPHAQLPRRRNWNSDACLPLVTEGPIVAAIRVQLLDRAKQLGWTLSNLAALRFETEGGEDDLGVHALSDTFYRLIFPAHVKAIALSSSTFVPRHTDVETYDDRRLGVPLHRLDVHDSNGFRKIALDDPGLSEGFHAIQQWQGDRWRWTNGRGTIASSLWADAVGLVTLEIELARDRGRTRAWLEPTDDSLPHDNAYNSENAA